MAQVSLCALGHTLPRIRVLEPRYRRDVGAGAGDEGDDVGVGRRGAEARVERAPRGPRPVRRPERAREAAAAAAAPAPSRCRGPLMAIAPPRPVSAPRCSRPRSDRASQASRAARGGLRPVHSAMAAPAANHVGKHHARAPRRLALQKEVRSRGPGGMARARNRRGPSRVRGRAPPRPRAEASHRCEPQSGSRCARLLPQRAR